MIFNKLQLCGGTDALKDLSHHDADKKRSLAADELSEVAASRLISSPEEIDPDGRVNDDVG